MFLFRRLLGLIPVLLVISLLAFVLVRLAPGGPFDRERAAASPEVEAQLRARYRLDDPWWRQYAAFLGGALRGDLGPSLKYRGHSVTEIIAQAVPVSFALGGLAFGFALGVGLPLGFWGAVRRGRWGDYGTSFVALLAVCVPAFVVGPLLVMVFAVKAGWLPVALLGGPLHFVLPTVALGAHFAGKVARLIREGMAETLRAKFIRTARAKGLSETAVLLRHALPLAALPVVTYAGPLLADLLTGSFVVENLFQLPGLGTFMVNASLNRDYPLVIGIVLLYAVLLLGLNLLVDLAYGWLDPRVRGR